MRHVFAALLAALTVCAAQADPIDVSGVTKVNAGKLLRLKVKLADGEKAVWSVYPSGAADYESNDRGEFWMTAEPGPYTVEVTVAGVKGGVFTRFDRLPIPVEIVGKQQQKKVVPPAPPVPDDGKKKTVPPPAPTPKAVGLFLIVVEDGTTRGVDAIKVLGDRTFWSGLQQRGHDYRFYNVKASESTTNGYMQALAAKGVSPPGLIVAEPVPGTDDATTRAVVALPKLTSDIDKLVKQYSTK